MDPVISFSSLVIPFAASLIALGFVIYLIFDILKRDQGTDKMIQISTAVQQGAKAFLKREYSYVSISVLAIAALISLSPFIRDVGLTWKTSISPKGPSW